MFEVLKLTQPLTESGGAFGSETVTERSLPAESVKLPEMVIGAETLSSEFS